jgi:predicted acyl esterase
VAPTVAGGAGRRAYWRQGSLRPAYERIACPTMLVAGWADGYRNATFRMVERLRVPTRLLFGPWSHMATDSSLPGPGSTWSPRWSAGGTAGCAACPTASTGSRPSPCRRHSTRPAPDLDEHPGAWRNEPTWPPERSVDLVLPLPDGPGHLGPPLDPEGLGTGPSPDLPAGAGADRLVVRADVGSAAWISCAGQLPFGQPVDQREDDAWSLRYDWPLEREVEVLGHPRLVVRVGASAPVAFLSAKLCDVFPDGASTWWPGGSST